MNRYIVFEGIITRDTMNKLFDEYTNVILQKRDEDVGVQYVFTDFDDEVGQDLVDFIVRSFALDSHQKLTAIQIATHSLNEFCSNPLTFCEPKIKWDIADTTENRIMLQKLARFCRPESSNFLKFLKDEMVYVYFVDRLLEELSDMKKICEKKYFELYSLAINTKGKESEEERGVKIQPLITDLVKQVVPA